MAQEQAQLLLKLMQVQFLEVQELEELEQEMAIQELLDLKTQLVTEQDHKLQCQLVSIVQLDLAQLLEPQPKLQMELLVELVPEQELLLIQIKVVPLLVVLAQLQLDQLDQDQQVLLTQVLMLMLTLVTVMLTEMDPSQQDQQPIKDKVQLEVEQVTEKLLDKDQVSHMLELDQEQLHNQETQTQVVQLTYQLELMLTHITQMLQVQLVQLQYQVLQLMVSQIKLKETVEFQVHKHPHLDLLLVEVIQELTPQVQLPMVVQQLPQVVLLHHPHNLQEELALLLLNQLAVQVLHLPNPLLVHQLQQVQVLHLPNPQVVQVHLHQDPQHHHLHQPVDQVEVPTQQVA